MEGREAIDQSVWSAVATEGPESWEFEGSETMGQEVHRRIALVMLEESLNLVDVANPSAAATDCLGS